MKALILTDKVVQLAQDEFPVASGLSWEDVADTVKVGDVKEGNNFVTPEPVIINKPLSESETLLIKLLQYITGEIKSDEITEAYQSSKLAAQAAAQVNIKEAKQK